MKKFVFLIIFVLGMPQWASAIEIVKKEDVEFEMGGRSQVVGIMERVDDPFKNDLRFYLFAKQARLNLSGRYEKFKFHVELGFAGEEAQVLAPNPGVALNLLDFYFDFPLWKALRLRVGQFVVPYSRERMADDSSLQFDDRSLNNLAFQVGRDLGVSLYATHGPFAAAFGVFTGGGRDIPQRFIPEKIGTPLFVARAGLNHGLDDGIYGRMQGQVFGLTQHAFEVEETKWAAFVNGFFMKDSKVGHSTLLNVKTAEKSLLLNGNWNPFVGQAPLVQGNLWQMGWDVALRKHLRFGVLSSEAELNIGRYSNAYGHINLIGGRAQAGLYRKPFEYALRYSFILPSPSFANGGVSVTGGRMIHEITPALTFHLKPDRFKIILDAPLLIDVPVVTEPGVGSYVLTEMPDQASLLNPTKGGTVSRRFVAEGRILFQLSF